MPFMFNGDGHSHGDGDDIDDDGGGNDGHCDDGDSSDMMQW